MGMPALLKVAEYPEDCVVINNNDNYDGAFIQLWECDGSVQAQQWWVSYGKLVNAAYTDKCLVVDSNRGENGQHLQLWSCNGDEQYKTWTLPGRSLRGIPTEQSVARSPGAAERKLQGGSEFRWMFDQSYCMSVVDNVFQNGQKMQLWECAGGSGQYFDYSPYHHSMPALLKVAEYPEYCVVINNNDNYDGAAIQLWECDGSVQAQQWYVDPSGKIVNAAYTDKCLVVDSNRGQNGQHLQLWSCSGDEQYKTWNRLGRSLRGLPTEQSVPRSP